jgi:hypothetical protein
MVEPLWEILVPCNYNDGKPVRTKHHKEWDKVVRKISGGLTLYTPAKGQWVDPNDKKLYEDRMIPVRIKCSEQVIKQIAQFTLGHYRQKAVLIYRVSDYALVVTC